ncbi:MAG: hypothetical protein COA79_20955 [Planctomycetota bacterium]|nr:MAG: hypothetical protein COA79_20955 [Planctomycetota bacterium]
MPDISLCLNASCPLASNCKRFLLIPSDYQVYSDFKPDENGNCKSYIEFKVKRISRTNRLKDRTGFTR